MACSSSKNTSSSSSYSNRSSFLTAVGCAAFIGKQVTCHKVPVGGTRSQLADGLGMTISRPFLGNYNLLKVIILFKKFQDHGRTNGERKKTGDLKAKESKKILSVCTINSHFICKKFGSRQHNKREGKM